MLGLGPSIPLRNAMPSLSGSPGTSPAMTGFKAHVQIDHDPA
jgi:hypothetical protein